MESKIAYNTNDIYLQYQQLFKQEFILVYNNITTKAKNKSNITNWYNTTTTTLR